MCLGATLSCHYSFSYIFFCLSHLATYLSVLHFSGPFLSFSQPFCCTNFVQPESCPPLMRLLPKKQNIQLHPRLCPQGRKKERIRRQSRLMRRPRRRDQGRDDPPYEGSGRDHGAGGEAKKTKEVYQPQPGQNIKYQMSVNLNLQRRGAPCLNGFVSFVYLHVNLHLQTNPPTRPCFNVVPISRAGPQGQTRRTSGCCSRVFCLSSSPLYFCQAH